MSQGKVAKLPQLPAFNLEVEQSVIGAILLRPSVLDIFADELSPEDFYRSAHAEIYRTILDLREKSEPVDLVTVTMALKSAGKLDEVGGPVFIASLSENVGTAANAPHYVKIVLDHAVMRRLEEAAQRIQAACQRRPDNVVELLDWSEREVFKVAERKSSLKLQALGDLALETYKTIETLWENNRPAGISTGFSDFDRYTNGLQRGEMTILAARPSMGKTALALDIALNVGRDGGKVGFFSLEMSKEQLTRRVFASAGKIEAENLKTGRLSTNQWAQLLSIVDELERLPIQIDDKPSASLAEIRGASRRLKATEGLDVVIVDYLQLVRFTGKGARNREQEVSEISRGLKALARELNIPVLVVAQLSRECEKRPNKRPILADLRESGAIEQDADVVLMLYRDEVYNENTTAKGVCEGLIRKQRNGPTGKFLLTFESQFTKFSNHSGDRELF